MNLSEVLAEKISTQVIFKINMSFCRVKGIDLKTV